MSNTGLIIILAFLGFLFLFFTISIIILLIFRSLKKSRICRLKDDGIISNTILYLDEKANFFGIKSSGLRTVRGNGIFVLNQEEIYFSLFLPDKEYKIPIDTIEKVETAKSFLGKTKFRKLLIIDFKEKDGTVNSAAWLLTDLNKALDLLTELINK